MHKFRTRCVPAIAVFFVIGAAQAALAAGAANNADLVPPLAPAADEILVRGIAAWSLHVQLNECLQSSEHLLTDPARDTLHVRIGDPAITVNQKWGYLLRADFTRDDVAPPMVNRILCWADGQIIATRLSVQPLSLFTSSRQPLAVPGAVRH